jgi:hypothetical protein
MEKITNIKDATEALAKLSDEDLAALAFSMPWQFDPIGDTGRDPDGFKTEGGNGKTVLTTKQMQQVCFEKFEENPQIHTAVRGLAGRLTGFGFEVSTSHRQLADIIYETEMDWRNRLYNYWPKYVARSFIEGELHLCLTAHPDGFVEVDFIAPTSVSSIIYHPFKVNLPVLYNVEASSTLYSGRSNIQIPSIFVAHSPDLISDLLSGQYIIADAKINKTSKKMYKDIGGFKRFIVSWDKGFITDRNTSYLKTVLIWLNHYETLKKYEIDHKKSAGAYVWVIKFTDVPSFRLWMSLPDDEKRKTGVMAKLTPGGRLFLPPGMEIEAKNPNLQKISESDTDILHMATSGLNEPEDVTTGQSKGTFASVKATRGPMSDRISDEVAYFERFLKYDFYGSIFFLKFKLGKMPDFYKVRKVVEFVKKKPIFETVPIPPAELIDVSFPISETTDMEGRTRALLGVKHGSTYDTLGVSNAYITRKIGISGNYKKIRMEQATEEENYPDTILTLNQEAQQEAEVAQATGGTKTGTPANKPVNKPATKPVGNKGG